MGLLDALWRFARSGADDGSPPFAPAPTQAAVAAGDDPDNADVEPVITDSGELNIGVVLAIIGDAPIGFDGPIVITPYAPSRLQEAPEQVPAPSVSFQVWSPRHHALALLAALFHWGFAEREVCSARLRALYGEVCRRLRWEPLGWNAVASQFRTITGAAKRYRWFRLDDGQPHRLRVFPIPARMPTTRIMPTRQFAVEARSAA